MTSRNRALVLLALCAIAAVLLAQTYTWAAPKAEKTAAKEKDPPATRVHRMPAYYTSVITDDQRAKIVAIQDEFGPQIQQKRQELKALSEQQDAAIYKLLKPAQRKEVDRLRAEAKARRQAAGITDEDGEMEDEASAKPDSKKSK